VLLAVAERRDVYVNGSPLVAGIRLLRDRDEIRMGNVQRLFFSTERLACTEPFPGSEKPVVCPRCKQEIKKAQPSVRCPNPKCGAWHHESAEEELPCWTYAAQCGNVTCDQQTQLGSGYRWTPEDL